MTSERQRIPRWREGRKNFTKRTTVSYCPLMTSQCIVTSNSIVTSVVAPSMTPHDASTNFNSKSAILTNNNRNASENKMSSENRMTSDNKMTSGKKITSQKTMMSENAMTSKTSKNRIASKTVIMTSLLTLVMTLSVVTSQEQINLAVLLPASGNFPWIIPKVEPAIRYAASWINIRGILPGKKLELQIRDTQCSETVAPIRAMEMYYVTKLAHVFIGPACNYALAPVARFSYHWNTPVLTAGALVKAFDDKKEYRLLTRVLGTYHQVGKWVIRIFDRFRWTTSALFFQDTRTDANSARSECYFAMEGIFEVLTAQKKQPFHVKYNVGEKPDYAKLLRDVSNNARDYYDRRHACLSIDDDSGPHQYTSVADNDHNDSHNWASVQ